MGVKHNVVAKIYSFKQAPYKIVRNCANNMKQYIARCPKEEKLSEKRLISLFLEGLTNKILHAHLYAKKHTSFNECCLDAMDYDDNFDVDDQSSLGIRKNEKTTSEKSLEASIVSTKEINLDVVAKIVLKRMGKLYHPLTYLYSSSTQGTYRW